MTGVFLLMKDRLIFIESNTTGTGMLALKKARSWGLTPTLYTHNPDRYLDLADTGSDVYVCDTNDRSSLQQEIEKTVPRTEMRGITTTSEFYLETVATLSSTFDRPGNPLEAIRKARNKALTRQVLLKAGIKQPHFALVRHLSELSDAVDRLPCVVKPADDSGSNDVKLCETVEQVKSHAANILAQRVNVRGQPTAGVVLIEEYIDAPEFSVEMIGWQGEMICLGITQKMITGFPYFVEYRHIFPAPLTDEQEEEIKETVRQALHAVGLRNGATHTEVKWTDQGCVIIEINARLAGGMIPELIHQSTGVDVLEQHLRCAMDGPVIHRLSPRCVAGIQFFLSEQEGTFIEANGVEEAKKIPGVTKLKITATPGKPVRPPQNAYDRLGYVIAQAENAEQTVKRLQSALDQVRFRIENQE
jgi:biotin carboxylase